MPNASTVPRWSLRVIRPSQGIEMVTYFSRSGREILLSCEAECAAAIRSGALHRESQIMDCRTGRWMRAADHAELSAMLASIAAEAAVPRPSEVFKAKVFKAGASVAWIAAIAGPALIARAANMDAALALALTLTCALGLCAAGLALRLVIRSPAGRRRLSLLFAILTFAAGASSMILFRAPLGP